MAYRAKEIQAQQGRGVDKQTQLFRRGPGDRVKSSNRQCQNLAIDQLEESSVLIDFSRFILSACRYILFIYFSFFFFFQLDEGFNSALILIKGDNTYTFSNA
jgi:hypothetical protein